MLWWRSLLFLLRGGRGAVAVRLLACLVVSEPVDHVLAVLLKQHACATQDVSALQMA
jgi:hypothetical protein